MNYGAATNMIPNGYVRWLSVEGESLYSSKNQEKQDNDTSKVGVSLYACANSGGTGSVQYPISMWS